MKECLQISIKAANRINNLVKRILRLLQVDTPDAKIVFEKIRLSNEVDNVLVNIKDYTADITNMNFINDIDDNIVVEADRILLVEVFENLIVNAIKYSPNGGNIIIDAKEEKMGILISIQDQGIGLTNEQMSMIFNVFYKADESRHDLESSGLGLSITKRIIENHGGDLWVESEGLDKGSTFYFILPYQNIDINTEEIKHNFSIEEN
jgi:signal transduction histidine kinase